MEEAAENVSLSSNSSLVMKFLGKKKADNKKVAEEGTNPFIIVMLFKQAFICSKSTIDTLEKSMKYVKS